jgi:hypothetical protein
MDGGEWEWTFGQLGQRSRCVSSVWGLTRTRPTFHVHVHVYSTSIPPNSLSFTRQLLPHGELASKKFHFALIPHFSHLV